MPGRVSRVAHRKPPSKGSSAADNFSRTDLAHAMGLVIAGPLVGKCTACGAWDCICKGEYDEDDLRDWVGWWFIDQTLALQVRCKQVRAKGKGLECGIWADQTVFVPRALTMDSSRQGYCTVAAGIWQMTLDAEGSTMQLAVFPEWSDRTGTPKFPPSTAHKNTTIFTTASLSDFVVGADGTLLDYKNAPDQQDEGGVEEDPLLQADRESATRCARGTAAFPEARRSMRQPSCWRKFPIFDMIAKGWRVTGVAPVDAVIKSIDDAHRAGGPREADYLPWGCYPRSTYWSWVRFAPGGERDRPVADHISAADLLACSGADGERELGQLKGQGPEVVMRVLRRAAQELSMEPDSGSYRRWLAQCEEAGLAAFDRKRGSCTCCTGDKPIRVGPSNRGKAATYELRHKDGTCLSFVIWGRLDKAVCMVSLEHGSTVYYGDSSSKGETHQVQAKPRYVRHVNAAAAVADAAEAEEELGMSAAQPNDTELAARSRVRRNAANGAALCKLWPQVESRRRALVEEDEVSKRAQLALSKSNEKTGEFVSGMRVYARRDIVIDRHTAVKRGESGVVQTRRMSDAQESTAVRVPVAWDNRRKKVLDVPPRALMTKEQAAAEAAAAEAAEKAAAEQAAAERAAAHRAAAGRAAAERAAAEAAAAQAKALARAAAAAARAEAAVAAVALAAAAAQVLAEQRWAAPGAEKGERAARLSHPAADDSEVNAECSDGPSAPQWVQQQSRAAIKAERSRRRAASATSAEDITQRSAAAAAVVAAQPEAPGAPEVHSHSEQQQRAAALREEEAALAECERAMQELEDGLLLNCRRAIGRFARRCKAAADQEEAAARLLRSATEQLKAQTPPPAAMHGLQLDCGCCGAPRPAPLYDLRVPLRSGGALLFSVCQIDQLHWEVLAENWACTMPSARARPVANMYWDRDSGELFVNGRLFRPQPEPWCSGLGQQLAQVAAQYTHRGRPIAGGFPVQWGPCGDCDFYRTAAFEAQRRYRSCVPEQQGPPRPTQLEFEQTLALCAKLRSRLPRFDFEPPVQWASDPGDQAAGAPVAET
eukprot:TRINITY_DN10282_c0_g1_i1.p1 TRINITY_DN10282_c0_g1~~TRINITY_DN10282_c0_g1_i1.p1  ORF type:complete len:1053 (+),score=225.07 TRINITY_DN10282_c0_g1_i1:91-3249(+)